MDWKDLAENFWDEVKDRSYYIIAVILLILFPLIVGAPPSTIPILNLIYNGSRIPILSDIYDSGRDILGAHILFGTNTYFINIIALCAIWAIFAASWDFLTGY
ncbi:MAG: hypothetical protein ACFE9L_18755, partial [Candidatus Hodarchaeota archaeon]